MKALWIILAVLFVAAPSFAQDVKYTYDKKADFSKYKTYRWEKHPKSIDIDEATLRQLGAAFDAELAKKGLARTNSETADIVIVYQAAIGTEEKVEAFRAGWGVEPVLDAADAHRVAPGHRGGMHTDEHLVLLGHGPFDLVDTQDIRRAVAVVDDCSHASLQIGRAHV